jgi:hypothetical protein
MSKQLRSGSTHLKGKTHFLLMFVEVDESFNAQNLSGIGLSLLAAFPVDKEHLEYYNTIASTLHRILGGVKK